MKETIQEHISDIADEYNITPIVARSFGSHMMNLDSSSSDYDVFMLFAQEPSAYWRPGSYEDVITRSFGEIDFQCWNVKKFGILLDDSNPTTMEFLNSPVTYFEDAEYADDLSRLRRMANEHFRPIGLYYHYRSMAEDNYMKYIKESIYDGSGTRYPIISKVSEFTYQVDTSHIDDMGEMTHLTQDSERWDEQGFHVGSTDRSVKRTLYIVRAILHAKYIRTTHNMPTMDFQRFVETLGYGDLGLDEDEKDELMGLVRKKKFAHGDDTVDNTFKEFIEDELSYDLDHEKHKDGEMDTEMIHAFIDHAIR